MPFFVTIGYGDRAGYEATDAALRQAAHRQDAALAAGGTLIGRAGTPVQVRNPDATGVDVTPGAYMGATLPVAGFAILEAPDLEAAIAMVSGVPCAVAHGVVEIWPLEQG